jgi:ankyrin repeat protein
MELELETKTPSDVIPPGMTVGKMSQMRGIKVRFLLAFTIKYNCWDWNSWDVIRRIIKPLTERDRCRFIELVMMAGNVGPASTFISYAQAGKWGDLVAAILDGGADLDRYVWIDVFAIRQWPSSTPDLDFASTIQNCSSFLIVCSYIQEVKDLDWSDVRSRNISKLPLSVRKLIAFLRVWCLAELNKAAMMPNMPIIMKCGSHNLLDDGSVRFTSDYDTLFNLCFLIDIKKADATVQSDKDLILAAVEISCGIEHLNHVARGALSGSTSLVQFENAAVIQCAACGDEKSIEIIKADPKSIFGVAAGGYTVLLKLLILSGTNVHDKSNDGNTPLMFASKGGHLDCVKLLFDHGANVHDKDKNGTTSLLLASMGGHLDCVKLLFDQGANVDDKDNDGDTPIIVASMGGHLDCMKLLFDHGANVHDKDNDGRTSLLLASMAGHLDCMRLLFDQGANDNL